MMVIAELRRKGLSLQKLRRIIRPVRREIERRLDKLLSGKAELFILTDGASSFFEDHAERIVEVLKGSRKPLFLASLSDHARRLTEFQQLVNKKERRRDQLRLF
jgi:hypothetical protein